MKLQSLESGWSGIIPPIVLKVSRQVFFVFIAQRKTLEKFYCVFGHFSQICEVKKF